MSETRDAFGPLLRQMQAEIRSLKADIRSLHEDSASRSYIASRAEETEILIQSLFSQLDRRLDQTEQSVEERLTRIELILNKE